MRNQCRMVLFSVRYFTHSFADIHIAAVLYGNFALIVRYLWSGREWRYTYEAPLYAWFPSKNSRVADDHTKEQECHNGENEEYQQQFIVLYIIAELSDSLGRMHIVCAPVNLRLASFNAHTHNVSKIITRCLL